MIPKKLASDLIPGWMPVFGNDHAPNINSTIAARGFAFCQVLKPSEKHRHNRNDENQFAAV
jgi:hypothetical protein